MEASTWHIVGALLLSLCSGPTKPVLCLQAPTCIFWTEVYLSLSLQKGFQEGLSFILVLQLWEVSDWTAQP